MKQCLGILLLLFNVFALAQFSRTVALTWTDAVNPTGTTYSIYRSNSGCSNPTFAKIAEGITAKAYDDAVTSPGRYCYVATATYGAEESAYSNSAEVRVRPFAPMLEAVVK